MRLPRLLPVILLVGGAYQTAKRGEPAARLVMDTTRTLGTEYELTSIVKRMEADAALGLPMPEPDIEGAFKSYLDMTLTGRFGRDPTVDFWGQPYGCARDDQEQLFVYSLGPNGELDVCGAEGGHEPEAMVTGTDADADDDAEFAAASDEPQAGDDTAETVEDDLCVTVHMPANDTLR